MSNHIPDMTERFPDAGEPAQEKEHVINAWVPMMIEVRAYGTDQAEAIKAAKLKLKQTSVKEKVVDWDLSEMDVTNIEEV